ncbi:MAG: tetratricopeptide repeat protein, partial [Deltaproteobacteria bacterium]|nr:tetratricopeptide repeat protein [Deltaproteobacteria bacterium]
MSAVLLAALLAAAPPPASPDAPPSAPSTKRSTATAPASSPASPPPPERVGDGDPIFTRDEPSLAAARRALDADDADLAVDRARAAVSTHANERAVVEYDAAQALRARARKDAAAAQASSSAPGGPAGPGAPAPPAKPPNLDEAIASFERAAGLAVDRRLQSEARLAAGNAALEAGKLDDAIGALRKALVADPANDRARRNLQRALEAKKAQPPPPPKQGGDEQSDQKNDDQKNDEQDQQQDQQQQDQPKQDQPKQDQQQQDQQQQDQPKQDQP